MCFSYLGPARDRDLFFPRCTTRGVVLCCYVPHGTTIRLLPVRSPRGTVICFFMFGPPAGPWFSFSYLGHARDRDWLFPRCATRGVVRCCYVPRGTMIHLFPIRTPRGTVICFSMFGPRAGP